MANTVYDNFSTHVFEKFEKNITERIFLLIEDDRELQKEYLDLVASKGRATVNRWLGRKIKDHYGLQSQEPIKDTPKAKQIQGYTKLRK